MPTDAELLKTLTCFCAAENFNFDAETLGHIGTIDQLELEVRHRYTPFARRTEYASSILAKVDSPLEYIIDELYPMLIEEKQEVFFVHPVILSALTALDGDALLKSDNKIALMSFIRLLEKCKSEREFQTLRFTDEAEYFKKIGVEFSSLRNALRLAFGSIVVSKLLNECF
jgi:hypothetical protein